MVMDVFTARTSSEGCGSMTAASSSRGPRPAKRSNHIPGAWGCQGRAPHQNFGYRGRSRTSEVTVTHSEPREEPVTRPSLREYAAVLREWYASWVQIARVRFPPNPAIYLTAIVRARQGDGPRRKIAATRPPG